MRQVAKPCFKSRKDMIRGCKTQVEIWKGMTKFSFPSQRETAKHLGLKKRANGN